jgi:uncharacterized membrane protein
MSSPDRVRIAWPPVWAIPMLYVVASVAAALVLPRLEHAYLPEHVTPMAVDSARQFFSAIASGMLAFTGIVFAIALMAVQFSAAAYSPRLATILFERPLVFHALGIFFATFTYALAGLSWSGRGGSDSAPLLSTLIVGILMVISMLAFAWLIHSIRDLQIHWVLDAVGSKGRAVVETMPAMDSEGQESAAGESPLPPDPPLHVIFHAGRPQVVAEFDLRSLLHLARSAGAIIAIQCSVGDTLIEGASIASVHGATHAIPEAQLRAGIRLGPIRTYKQDPRYPVRLLVDVAIRALSPAVNDPTTAVQALDQIEDILRRLGTRSLTGGLVRDEAGVVRVVFPAPTWQDYLELSFDEIRQYGIGSLQVQRRLRAALQGLAGTLPPGERRTAVHAYLEHLDEALDRAGFDAVDRAAGLVADLQGLGSPRHQTDRTP